MGDVIIAPAPRSKFVTVIGWLGWMGGAGTTLFACAMLASRFTLAGLATLAGGAVAVVSSHSLLKRREWARQAFIGVQIYGVAVLVVRALFPGSAFWGVKLPNPLPPRVIEEAVAMQRTAALISLAYAAVVAGLVIAGLSRKRVREEFAAEE